MEPDLSLIETKALVEELSTRGSSAIIGLVHTDLQQDDEEVFTFAGNIQGCLGLACAMKVRIEKLMTEGFGDESN